MMNRQLRLLLPLFALTMIGMSCTPRRDLSPPPVPTSRSNELTPPAADVYHVKLETSKGDILIEVHPEWAPRGSEQFQQLVDAGFYNDCRFFRVLAGFMCQVGMNGNPEVHRRWSDRTILDDPVIQSNKPGYVTFAKTGAPNSRSTQFFINYGDNSRLDRDGFAPFGKVIEGMDIALAINSQYAERPSQDDIRIYGNEYLNRMFPNLDYIIRASIVLPGDDDSGDVPEATTSEE